MNGNPGKGWEFESGLWKTTWSGAFDVNHAKAVLGNGKKVRALVKLFVDHPDLHERRDGVARLLNQETPLIDMPPLSVEGCRGRLGKQAFHVHHKRRLNPVSADLSGGPDAVWYMRPDVRAAFAQVLYPES